MSLAKQIKDKARELGIEACGIIRPEAMLEYGEKLRERMGKIPNGEALYGGFTRFADIKAQIPWAKSIVVTVLNYGHYRLPESIANNYGNCYLVEPRYNHDSPERQQESAMEEFLESIGLRVETSEFPGITGMRWAAYMAGLGIIRRNNFFYTDNGSWHHIVAWVTDGNMELIEKHNQPECPPNCDRCIKACPTKSLSEPYTMNMATCVSFLSVSGSTEPFSDEVCGQMGTWMYGCDACQEACPMNKGKWREDDDFPGLMELSTLLTPEGILEADYSEIEERLTARFFYIKQRNIWRWKLNAINTLVNSGREDASDIIRTALDDEYEVVRDKAAWSLRRLAGQDSQN